MNKNKYRYNDYKIIHSSVLIQTSDNKLAFGGMNEGTDSPFNPKASSFY